MARAEQYPHFSIPLILKPDTSYVHQFFQAQSLLWSAGMWVAQPVYTGGGGHLAAQVDAAQAQREEARQMYRQTVLHAFQEVEDALVRYNAAGWRVNALRDSVAHNHQAFDRAQALYDAGLTDFLNLLDAERDVYAAEDSLSRAELARLRHLIALYKALGAGGSP